MNNCLGSCSPDSLKPVSFSRSLTIKGIYILSLFEFNSLRVCLHVSLCTRFSLSLSLSLSLCTMDLKYMIICKINNSDFFFSKEQVKLIPCLNL